MPPLGRHHKGKHSIRNFLYLNRYYYFGSKVPHRRNPVRAQDAPEDSMESARLMIRFDGNLRADSPAQGHHAVIDDAVEDLHAVTPLAQYARLVKRVEML